MKRKFIIHYNRVRTFEKTIEANSQEEALEIASGEIKENINEPNWKEVSKDLELYQEVEPLIKFSNVLSCAGLVFDSKTDKDVHTEHCCYVCGCKYNDISCTVTNGIRKKSSPHSNEGCYYDFESRI